MLKDNPNEKVLKKLSGWSVSDRPFVYSKSPLKNTVSNCSSVIIVFKMWL